MTVSSDERDLSKINRAIQQVEQGRINASGICTLRASNTTTVVAAPNCGLNSQVQLQARTANAAAAVATTFVSAIENGSFTITHASAASTDRRFGYTCIG